MTQAAIFYAPETFDWPEARVDGRRSAGASFLPAYLRHSGADRVTGFVQDAREGEAFVELVRRSRPDLEASWASPWRLEPVEAEGALFVFDPRLSDHAWRRRARGGGGYSLCGITHTIASHAAMDAFADYLLAPLQSWDALICTSRSVRAAVETVLDAQQAYLAERFGGAARPAPRLQLPVLPLGVDTAAFAPAPGDRSAFRERLGIPERASVVISLGRQSLRAKANPLPLFLALEQAATRTGTLPHLILAGWFPSPGEEAIFRAQAAALAPSVALHVAEVPSPEAVRQALAGADIFVSLIDNLQESFGLATVEAMAAGLPVVVSDWDGMRDTVEHGVQGFRVPTLMAPGGAGGDLALRYGERIDGFNAYLGGASQFAAVDVAAASERLAELLADGGLRARLGASGAARARALYDWGVVIPQYQALWAELSARRASDAASGRSWDAGPAASRLDPFTAFAAHPTRVLERTDRVRLGEAAALGGATGLLANPGAALAPALLPSAPELELLLGSLRGGRSVDAETLVQALPPERRVLAFRALAWLAKFDLVRISPAVAHVEVRG